MQVTRRPRDTPLRVRALVESLLVAAAVTSLVTVASGFVPDAYVAMAVGFVFLAATWALVWRSDDVRVSLSGLTLGGLVLPGPLNARRLFREVCKATLWALAFGALTFAPFFFGWRAVWHVRGSFALHGSVVDLLNEISGQLLIIALPEEAFYRGYLQSRLDEAFPSRVTVLGAPVGLALLATSIIFALGHFATIREPARLAVFFPSLAFGWLRCRTRGIGASVAFHALCNVFSALLGHGFRVY